MKQFDRLNIGRYTQHIITGGKNIIIGGINIGQKLSVAKTLLTNIIQYGSRDGMIHRCIAVSQYAK